MILLVLTPFNVPYVLWIMSDKSTDTSLHPTSSKHNPGREEALTEEMFEALRKEFHLGTLK